VRHDLQKGDKKLQKCSVQASKDPTKDLGKVSKARTPCTQGHPQGYP